MSAPCTPSRHEHTTVSLKNDDTKRVSFTPFTRTVSTTPSKKVERTTSASLDFVGSGSAVKDLLLLPHISNKSVSIAIHNLGGTLVIDHPPFVDTPPTAQSPQTPQLPAPPPHRLNWAELCESSDDEEPQKAQMKVQTPFRNIASSNRWADLCESSDDEAPLVPPQIPLSPPAHTKLMRRNSFASPSALFRHANFPITIPENVLCAIEGMLDKSAIVPLLELEAGEDGGKMEKKNGDGTIDFLSPPPASEAYQFNFGQFGFSVQSDSPPSTIFRDETTAVSLRCADSEELADRMQLFAETRNNKSHLQPSTVEKNDNTLFSCLDVYLDQLMTNVPQLALALEKKGLIQAIKVISTADIPSVLMEKYNTQRHSQNVEPIFDPTTLELDSSLLLDFLKENCATDNTTYLLQKNRDEKDVHLFDVTALSSQRQRKWTHWLAMMSYRFAKRIGQQAAQASTTESLGRVLRARQRNLFESSLDLLNDLNDMDGGRGQETIIADVHCNIAETFLSSRIDGGCDANASSSEDAAAFTDRLQNAQKHLDSAERCLIVLLDRDCDARNKFSSTDESTETYDEMYGTSSDEEFDETISFGEIVVELKSPTSPPRKTPSKSKSSPNSNDGSDPNILSSIEREAIESQLQRALTRLIDVTNRLIESHFSHYRASAVSTCLRKASNSLKTLALLKTTQTFQSAASMHAQKSKVWELAGTFARSFAADEKWNSTGHTSSDDILSLLIEIEKILGSKASINVTDECSITFSSRSILLPLELETSAKIEGGKKKKKQGKAALPPPTLPTAENINEMKAAEEYFANDTKRARDSRAALVGAALCYELSIASASSANLNTTALLNKSGDTFNEIGNSLLSSISKISSSKKLILHSATFFFNRALSVSSSTNVALIRCNLAQIMKHRQDFEAAAEHLRLAHLSLVQRTPTNSHTWDVVSNEIAATYLTMGVRKRQKLLSSIVKYGGGSGNNEHKKEEASVVANITKAVEVYKELNNRKQAAAGNYQLALFYSKLSPLQRESVARDYLSKAFACFHDALQFFSTALGEEPSFVIMCMDCANLYAVTDGGILPALCHLSNCAHAFEQKNSLEFVKDTRLWESNMSSLILSVSDVLGKLLLRLLKMDKSDDGVKLIYKEFLQWKASRPRSEIGENHEMERIDFAKLLTALNAMVKTRQKL